MSNSSPVSHRTRVLAGRILFWCYLGAWTTLLVIAHPEKLLFFRIVVPEGIAVDGPWDKVVHATGYLVLFVLTMAAYGSGPAGFPQSWLFAACAAQGALTEVIQAWVPSRTADVADWLADVAGVAAGVCVVAIWRYLRRPREVAILAEERVQS